MISKSKTIISLIAIILFFVIATILYQNLSTKYTPDKSENEENVEKKEEEKMEALDFTVTNSEGEEVSLSDFFGKPIVLNFWASWCPPCKSEMPHFNKTYNEMSDDVTFLMVDLVDGQKETVEKGKNYIETNGFNFPVLFDNKQDAAYTYGIRSIPTTLFIDKDGKVSFAVEGAIDEKTLINNIDKILSSK